MSASIQIKSPKENEMAAFVTAVTPTAEHIVKCIHKGWAVFNPHNKPVSELPVIWGFNNGGEAGWLIGVLLSEDSEFLGQHVCSNESYMPNDLGVLKWSGMDRHEEFRKHYPDGYRMEFVGGDDVPEHAGIAAAYARHQQRYPASVTEPD